MGSELTLVSIKIELNCRAGVRELLGVEEKPHIFGVRSIVSRRRKMCSALLVATHSRSREKELRF